MGNFGYKGNDFNRFNGGIPPEIANLSKLVHLDMDYYGLNGSIPAKIGGLVNLEISICKTIPSLVKYRGNDRTKQVERVGSFTQWSTSRDSIYDWELAQFGGFETFL